MSTIVASKAVCFADGPREGWIAFDGGTLVDHGTDAPPASAVDLGAHILSPGFVDLQCNGLGAVDLSTADAAAWTDAQRTLARHGVTSYCPTFVTAPVDAYPRFLDAADAARASSGPDEASIVGVHLEGPFLGGALGAHDPSLVRAADLTWLRALVGRHPGLVRLVTLAPEADVDLEMTRWLSSSGITVALGHTTASYDDARAAADAGASVVTHLYNGMSPWHHRDPGVAGAALTDDRLTPTVIADLVHVHAAALRLVFDTTRVAVVSDAVGVVDGITASGGAAQLADGTLAGATTLLDGALANLVATGIPWPRAIESVTAVPAQLLELGDRGALVDGRRADIVALDPDSFRVERVWLAGEELAPRHQ